MRNAKLGIRNAELRDRSPITNYELRITNCIKGWL